MTGFSLSSPHKVLRRFLFVLIALFFFWLVTSALLTLFLRAQMAALKPLFSSEGLSLKYGQAYFNLFSGAVVQDLSCEDSEYLLWRVRRLDLGFDVTSAFGGNILIKNVLLGETSVYPGRISARLDAIRRVAQRMKNNVGFYATSYFGCDRFYVDGHTSLSLKGYFSSLQGGLYVSKGQLAVLSLGSLDEIEPGALKNSPLGDPFDFSVDIEARGDTWNVVRLEVSNSVLRCLGSGRLLDAGTEDPVIELEFGLPHLILDDLPLLNSPSVQTRGLAELEFHVNGPVRKPETTGLLRIAHADVEIFGAISLRKIAGDVVYAKNKVSSPLLCLLIDQVPFNVDFSVDLNDVPRVECNLTSAAKGEGVGDFSVRVAADWTKVRRLQGKIEGSWRYLSKDLIHHIIFDFKGFEAGVDEDLFISSREVLLSLDVKSAKYKALKGVFNRVFVLDNLFAVAGRQADGFALDPLKADCYRGTLEGRLALFSAPGLFGASMEAHVRGVDLEVFDKRSPGETSLESGRLDADLKFDTDAKDPFRGQLFVTNGVVGHNALLDAVSDFLGVASLKKIAFKNLSAYCSGGRGDYASKVTLKADDVSALLEGKIFSYDTMDGYLSVVISSQKLGESRQFKKILAYIKHDQPSVVFPFKISSYLQSPRVLWLKNEFQEKLSNLLPERNKRHLQKRVNAMVSGIREER